MREGKLVVKGVVWEKTELNDPRRRRGEMGDDLACPRLLASR